MNVLINLGNGWIVSTEEIRYVRPVKSSEQGNKSTVLLSDGEKVHTPLTADDIEARISDALAAMLPRVDAELAP